MNLNEDQLSAELEQLTDWAVEGNELTKTFRFGSYADNLTFVAMVGRKADQSDHHPDLIVTYPSVQVRTSTHTTGGITEKDISLARVIEAVAALI